MHNKHMLLFFLIWEMTERITNFKKSLFNPWIVEILYSNIILFWVRLVKCRWVLRNLRQFFNGEKNKYFSNFYAYLIYTNK